MRAPELTRLAAAWLARRHPGAVIVPELSVADWGGARIDVAAITPERIVGVEIKGEGDSPARLDRQGLAYGMVAREMWFLPCAALAKKCFEKAPRGWGKLEVFEGAVRPLNTARRLGPMRPTSTGSAATWSPDTDRYRPSSACVGGHLSPAVMCGALWRDELFEIARRCVDPATPGRARVHDLVASIVGKLSADEVHAEMIAALRARTWRRDVFDLRKPAGVEALGAWAA
jgi:hypothetical protein